MAQPVMTRSQRRLERKQLSLIVILIMAIAGVSFVLGVIYGGRGGTLPGLAVKMPAPKIPQVTQIEPPPQPQAGTPDEKPEKLTFYDNLPKGKQAPLGSGINLPPEQPRVSPAGQQKAVSQTASRPQAATASDAGTGAFIVQVASFRTTKDATELVERLKIYQLAAFVEAADLGQKGTWHRVLVGPYTDRQSADRAANLLREKERLSALVRQR